MTFERGIQSNSLKIHHLYILWLKFEFVTYSICSFTSTISKIIKMNYQIQNFTTHFPCNSRFNHNFYSHGDVQKQSVVAQPCVLITICSTSYC